MRGMFAAVVLLVLNFTRASPISTFEASYKGEDNQFPMDRALQDDTPPPTASPSMAPFDVINGTFSALCTEESTACFEDETCAECVLLGSVVLDSSEAITCDDAMGMFKNAYNGSTSTNSKLECEPYNELTLLATYLDCIWSATPCESGAAILAAGSILIISAMVGAFLL